jgi:DNA-binding NtrC family response regulator
LLNGDRCALSGEPLALRWVGAGASESPLWLDSRCVTMSARRDARGAASAGFQIQRVGALSVISSLSERGGGDGILVNGKPVSSVAIAAGDVVRFHDRVGVVVRAPLAADLGFGLLAPGIFGGYRHRLVASQLAELGRSDLPIVLEGETGTGKERFARALHAASPRRGAFLAVNCAVYSRAVAAAELFGYRRGAFTGAEQASIGHIRAAAGGTLLLDELGDLPLEVQSMLLRVIENREVLPLGETRPIPIDAGFIGATQSPLAGAVERGRFRSDLRARLEGCVLRLPSLRECREIVPEFLGMFLERYAGERVILLPEVVERLCMYDWPLNVRELETLAKRLVVAGVAGKTLDRPLLDRVFTATTTQHRSNSEGNSGARVPGRRTTVYDPLAVDALIELLRRTGGNVSRAAAELGITRQKAYRMLRTIDSESS